MAEYAPFLMVLFVVFVLLSGYPVAFGLAGSALLFGALGYMGGVFDAVYVSAIPERIFGIMRNDILIAVPLFVFMGCALQQGKISEQLLVVMGRLFGRLRGGMVIAVCLVGALLAASTGIVGATVVTMGLISLPVMMRYGYSPSLATGVITALRHPGADHPPEHRSGHTRRRHRLGQPESAAGNGKFFAEHRVGGRPVSGRPLSRASAGRHVCRLRDGALLGESLARAADQNRRRRQHPKPVGNRPHFDAASAAHFRGARRHHVRHRLARLRRRRSAPAAPCC